MLEPESNTLYLGGVKLLGAIPQRMSKPHGKSRIHIVQAGRHVPLPAPMKAGTIVQQQQGDPCCESARHTTASNTELPPPLEKIKAQLHIVEGVLCVEGGDADIPVILLPKSLQAKVIQTHHRSYYAGHFGVSKTTQRIRRRYRWPTVRADVKAFMKKCSICWAYTHTPHKATWMSIPVGTTFEVVAADIYGPLQKTASRRTHILVLIDHHTRGLELCPLPEATGLNVAEAIFRYWISRWGTMRVVLPGNGAQFVSAMVRQVTEVYAVKKLFSPPCNPRGNSIVESYMRMLKSALSVCLYEFKS